MSKTKRVTIKFSEEEYKILQNKSEENCMPVASYIREKIFFDAPIIKKHSFEFRVLKTLSFCAAVLVEVCKKFLSNKENEAVMDSFQKIAAENGLNPDEIKKNT